MSILPRISERLRHSNRRHGYDDFLVAKCQNRYSRPGSVDRANFPIPYMEVIAHAIAENRLRFVCQPIVTLPRNAPALYELLARIETDAGLRSAKDFIPSASPELLRVIDRMAVQAAVNDPEGIPHAVNLSSATANDYSFIEFVHDLLLKHERSVSQLSFEVTEAVAMGVHAPRVLRALKGMGHEVGLDDFGTGYNSFLALEEVEPHFLKIDGRFISTCLNSRTSRAIIKGILKIASELEASVICECIETKEIEQEILKLCGAISGDVSLLGQGWLYGKGEVCQWVTAK